MKYDLNQIKIEISSLNKNRDMVFQQYYKICGAIEILESMEKILLSEESQKEPSLGDLEKCDHDCKEQKNEDLVQYEIGVNLL